MILFSVKVEFKRNDSYFLFTAIIYQIGNTAQFTLHMTRKNTDIEIRKYMCIDKGVIFLQGSLFFT